MKLLACMAVVVAALAPAPALAQDETRIVLLHTNDLHGHVESWQGWEGELAGHALGGFHRLAGAVRSERARSDHVLLLDAGDTWGDTLVAAETRGAAIVDLMNALRYDAMAVGNHEPDFGAERMRELMSRARFPVLAANLTARGSGETVARPWLVREIGGVRLGIFGLAYPNTALTTAPKNTASLEFGEAAPAAQRAVRELRAAGADYIVALTHLGLGADRQLAERVPQIDVIVGGHSHNRVSEPMRMGRTLIVQAGAHGSDLGRLELVFEGKRLARSSYRLLRLDESVAPDATVAALVDRATAPLRPKAAQRVGHAGAWLVRAQTIAGPKPEKRDAESPVDSLFADALRIATKADVALLPGVGYGVAIAPGPITNEALRNLMPHASRAVTMTLIGSELAAVLEQSIENVHGDDPRAKVGGMVQVSGLKFAYEPKRPPHARLVSVEVGSQPLDPRGRYRVVTNSLLAAGGHGYRTLAAAGDQADAGDQYELVRAHLGSQPNVAPPPSGRIVQR